MSSTYVHYSNTASSLPSDYALLSRYAAARNLQELSDEAEETDVSDGSSTNEEPDLTSTGTSATRLPIPRRRARRSSFPTSYIRPINPIMGPLPDKTGHRSTPHQPEPTENTPLLAPLVPRIPEEVDGEDLSQLFWR